jgi:hypothetical protein
MKKILIISLIFITFNLNFALAQTAPLDVNLLQQLVDILQKLIQQKQIQLPQAPAVPMQESPKAPLQVVPSEIKLIHPEKLELPKEVKPAIPEIDKTKPFIPEVIRPILPDETREDDAIIQVNNLKITRIVLNPGINDVKAVFFAVRDINWRCMFWETEESPTSLACPQYLVKPILEKELAIQISNDTNLLLRNRKKAKIEDFNVGDKINVYGYMDKDNYSIDALIVRKIVSTPKPLPPIPVPTQPVPVPPPIPTPPLPISPTSAPPALQSPSIQVLSPNGGEKLELGKPYAIRWNAKNVNRINIYLENWGVAGASGPLTWLIMENVDASLGLWYWAPPQDIIPKITPGNLYKIKIEQVKEESRNPASDSSDNFFSIVESSPITTPGTPSLQVVYPNGFEKWEIGKPYAIRWNAKNVNRINIYLENWGVAGAGGPLTWLIMENVDASLGLWYWAPPQDIIPKITPGNLYKIKIEQVKEESRNPASDSSDNFFSIVESSPITTPGTPSIQVVYPNGFEKWEIGKTYTIRWNANNVNRINIFLEDWGSPGGGAVVYLIGKNINATLGSWSWTVSDEVFKIKPGSFYRIKIRQIDEGVPNPVSDYSDDFFSIVESLPTSTSTTTPTLGITSPRPQTPPQVRKGTNATLAKFYFTAPPGGEDIVIRSIKFRVMKNVLEPGATSTTLQPGDLGNISIFDGETGMIFDIGLWGSLNTGFIAYLSLGVPAGKTKIIEIKADIPINTSAKSFGTYLSNTDVEAYGNFERRATVLGSGEWYVEVVE